MSTSEASGDMSLESSSPSLSPKKQEAAPRAPFNWWRVIASFAVVILILLPLFIPALIQYLTRQQIAFFPECWDRAGINPCTQAEKDALAYKRKPPQLIPKDEPKAADDTDGLAPEVDLQDTFTRIRSEKFDRFCRPWYAAGFSLHDAVEAALTDPRNFTTSGAKHGELILREAFSEAALYGLSVVRTWAHTTTSRYPFQVAPGVYDEKGLRALDRVVEEARRHGLQLILSFVDNWKYYNGVDQYVDWSPTVPPRTMERQADKNGDPTPLDFATPEQQKYEANRHALFYTDPFAKDTYKNHIRTILMRNNTISGRLYKDDPTILSWSLINEPRCETWAVPGCNVTLQNWLQEMATYVKSLDDRHLLSIGSEGFYGYADMKFFNRGKLPNPADWAVDMGQSYILNTMIPEVDFGTLHSWPDTWGQGDAAVNFQKGWVDSHLTINNQYVKKPLLFEEFGRKIEDEEWSVEQVLTKRDPIYKAAYKATEDAIVAGGAMGGAMFWRWALLLHPDSTAGGYGVYPNDTTMEHVKSHGSFLRQVHNSLPPRPDCKLGAWFPVVNGTRRVCKNVAAASDVYYALYPQGTKLSPPAPNATELVTQYGEEAVTLAQQLKEGKTLVFATKVSCCRPGVGGFLEGCSDTVPHTQA